MTASGNPTITTANSVIGMPTIETARADNDVMRIVSPTVKARISATDIGMRPPATRPSVQYPMAKKATRATAAR